MAISTSGHCLGGCHYCLRSILLSMTARFWRRQCRRHRLHREPSGFSNPTSQGVRSKWGQVQTRSALPSPDREDRCFAHTFITRDKCVVFSMRSSLVVAVKLLRATSGARHGTHSPEYNSGCESDGRLEKLWGIGHSALQSVANLSGDRT